MTVVRDSFPALVPQVTGTVTLSFTVPDNEAVLRLILGALLPLSDDASYIEREAGSDALYTALVLGEAIQNFEVVP